MRIVFITNPMNRESALCLGELLGSDHTVVGVVTPRQRRKRRRSRIAALAEIASSHSWRDVAAKAAECAVMALRTRLRAARLLRGARHLSAEELAVASNVPLLAPARVGDPESLRWIESLRPDLIVVSFCSQILPPEVLRIPPHGGINLHRSLLPAYAGPRPVFWALFQGERRTGVTVHLLDEGIDTGAVVAQEALDIQPGDDEHRLGRRAALVGARLLRETVNRIARGPLEALPARGERSYFPRPRREQVRELRRRLAQRRRGHAALPAEPVECAGGLTVRLAEGAADERRWDEYVQAAEDATLYHQFGWSRVFRRSAGHQPLYLMAEREGEVCGVLPLVLVGSRLLGRRLVSVPYCLAGTCCDDEAAERALLEQAQAAAGRLKVRSLELRQTRPLRSDSVPLTTRTHKATFVIDLAQDEAERWRSLRKQVRNRVRKATKEGLELRSGRQLLPAFYDLFARAMREVGTPVFGMEFFERIVEEFPDQAEVFVLADGERTAAAKFVIVFRDTLHLVWAATHPAYRQRGANYLLTWEAIRLARERGLRWCDLGRATVDSGPFAFKSQWGAEVRPLYWQVVGGGRGAPDRESKALRPLVRVWRLLPLSVTRALGPRVVRYTP